MANWFASGVRLVRNLHPLVMRTVALPVPLAALSNFVSLLEHWWHCIYVCDKTRIHVMMPCEYIHWSASFICVYLTIIFLLLTSQAGISILVTFLLNLASALEACFDICHLIGYERKGLSSLQGIFAPHTPPPSPFKRWIKASGIVVNHCLEKDTHPKRICEIKKTQLTPEWAGMHAVLKCFPNPIRAIFFQSVLEQIIKLLF